MPEAETKEDTKKFTLRLGPESMRDIEWISNKYGGISFTEVFRKSIALEKYLLEQREAGDVILLENKRTGRQREVAFR
jgi:hypothetical protein